MLSTSLSGLRVIDFTQLLAGPTCTLMLADLGADVIKIESPNGELGRAFPPFLGGESASFLAVNRNKRSVALDLKNPEHLAAVQQLVATADVVVECFRPGVMDRLSLGYAAVSAVNPRVVYCSISAYGQDGPWKDLPGVDGVVQAVSGLMSVTGMPGLPPCKVQVPIVDAVTGYLATVSVLAALTECHRDDVGQHLNVSLFASAVALQHAGFTSYFADGVVPQRQGSAAPYASPNEALRCADGWIMVAAYHPERWWALCELLGIPELATDHRFSDLKSRVTNRQQLVETLEAQMTKRPKGDWLQRFQAADIICGPINDYHEVVESEQFVFADMAERIMHPSAGELTMPRSPIASVGEKPAARRPPPTLGQHTQEVLSELAAQVEQADV